MGTIPRQVQQKVDTLSMWDINNDIDTVIKTLQYLKKEHGGKNKDVTLSYVEGYCDSYDSSSGRFDVYVKRDENKKERIEREEHDELVKSTRIFNERKMYKELKEKYG